jgi:NodT family efflux transporter outer membrane factor (OMF) lipoprotein
MSAKSMLLLIVLLLAACTRPPRNLDSQIEISDAWHTFERVKNNHWNAPLVVEEDVAVEQVWWENFGDSTLNALVAEALANNKSIGIATTRIEEARAERLAARSILFPIINLYADAVRGNQGFYTTGKPLGYDDFQVQGNWEIDLFGKNQARVAQTQALVENAEILRQGVIVSLLAELARNYFDMRNYEKQLMITIKNLESQKKTYDLTVEQFKGAFASDFDVQRAAAQVSSTEARIPSLRISGELARNRISVLLGGIPGQYDCLLNQPQSLKPIDPQLIVAAPATVLATRPDVRAADRRFAAAISAHVAATRELFPTISLIAYYGLQLTTLFNTIPTWNFMGTLTQPVINFGRIQADILSTSASQDRAFLEFQETILEALEDMEDALASYLYDNTRTDSLRNAAIHNRKAEELSHQQFTNGYTPLLDVLVVQRNTLDAESALAESEFNLRKDLVNIYTAAGGGWSVY